MAFTWVRVLVLSATFFGLTSVALSAEALAQAPQASKSATDTARRAITSTDIEQWRFIKPYSEKLSADGKWFVYQITKENPLALTDVEVVARSTTSSREIRFPVGGGRFELSDDGRWLAAIVRPIQNAASASPAESLPGSSRVVLLNLATGVQQEIAGKGFAFAGPTWIVIESASPLSSGTSVTPSGLMLELLDLRDGTRSTLGEVGEYKIDSSGTWIAWTLGQQVRVRHLSSGQERTLATAADRHAYRGLKWSNDSSDALAFYEVVRNGDGSERVEQLLGYRSLTLPEPIAFHYRPAEDPNFPAGMELSASQSLRWSDDAATVFFSVRRPQVARPVDSDVGVVVWHWQDPMLQTKYQKQTQRKGSEALAAYHVRTGRFVWIGEGVATADLQGRWAVLMNAQPYALEGAVTGFNYADLDVVDVTTGERRRILTKYLFSTVGPNSAQRRFFRSPDGVHLLTWVDNAYVVWNLATGASHPLVGKSGPSFVETLNDEPQDTSRPILPATWLNDGSVVVLSDSWDLWAVPIEGGAPVNLTVDGRQKGIRYGYGGGFQTNIVGANQGGDDLATPLYVAAYAEWTKEAGIARIDGRHPGAQRVLWGEAASQRLTKATQADVFVFSRETPIDPADWYATDSELLHPRRLTDLGSQRQGLHWPSGVVLVDYKGPSGERLQAPVLLPENYQPGRRYPAIMQIYERRPHYTRLMFERPNYSQGVINPTVYASRGYVVVYFPDIIYRVGAPGTSALTCVLGAAHAAVAAGIVDPDRVGLTGYSWGGYETEFIVTQTSFFKAAAPGAGVSNFISSYGGIHKGLGVANSTIFEVSQTRMGVPYWENLEAYLRESPVFHAAQITTPILLQHNDADTSVNWLQGVEYYNVLRRLGKPIVMLQYKGAGHGLSKPEHKKDYSARLQAFFDHFLMGAPVPAWWQESTMLNE